MLTIGNRIYNGKLSRAAFFSSALIGVPLHELSHAIASVLFGHKIQGIKLIPTSSTGELGYVRHSWNTRSVYQSLGCFFIAIAPLITGSLFVLYIFKPDPINFYTTDFSFLVWFSLERAWDYVVFKSQTPTGVIELILASLCLFHCIPSNTDFTNAAKGSFGVLILAVATVMVLDYWGFNITDTGFLLWQINALVLMAYCLSLVWWGVMLVLSFVK